MTGRISRRGFAGLSLGGAAALAGCATPEPTEDEALRDLGAFELALPIVVAENAKKIPPSRDATEAQWQTILGGELERRFGRYEGGTPYFIAVNVDGYSLAPPGVPIVLAPKSILIVSANLWTVEPQEKIAGPEQISAFEGVDSALLGSGLTKNAEEQMTTLSRNMARKILGWMLRNPAWFGMPT